MSSEALPSPQELLSSALTTVPVRLLPGRYQPAYPVPVRCGVPTSQGKLRGGEPAWLIGPHSEVLPAQTEVLSQWPDGSPRWVLVDVMMPVKGVTPTAWTVVFTRSVSNVHSSEKIQSSVTAHRILLQSAGLNFEIHCHSGITHVATTSADLHIAAWNLPEVQDIEGKFHEPEQCQVEMEVGGPVRVTLKCSASYPQLSGLRMAVRQSFFVGIGLVQTDITWHNPHRARHAGGLWDLGDAGSIVFQKAFWKVTTVDFASNKITYQLDPSTAWQLAVSNFYLLQWSSGGGNWNCMNHVDRTGNVPMIYEGFSAHANDRDFDGDRTTPAIRMSNRNYQLTGTIPKFWQTFPKRIDVSKSIVNFGLLPQPPDYGYELQGGEQTTHTVWMKIDLAGEVADQADLSWVHDPPRLVPVLGDQPVVPGWPRLTKLDAMPLSRLDSLCDEALHGPASVYARREEIDEYGWRNFGDFFADHETVYYRGQKPLISHYNNQYDVLGGLLLQWLRTENRQWWELADDLMRHVTDIDLYHTDEDRAVYSGGLFWLTDHYASCGTATHRTFTKLNVVPGKPYGGGPACEHNYTTGLLAYYWLTGEPAAKEAVLQLANWVIAMDDGRKTILGLVDDGPTGAATSTTLAEYQGPGRGAGNSINALLDAWLLSGERTYLQTAERFIHRCVHPADEIADWDLLNFELRWSYTVFFMALFKYLQCKEELGEIDVEFEYARQSLLHYARWMAEHERPYFDRAEQMEFPTETWGAQELRKANVFRWAAAYADDDELRTRLKTRGDEFAERAWHDLCRFPTRTFIRPFTLAMIQGLWDAALRTEIPHGTQRGPSPASWGEPMVFRNQRSRVKQMLKSPRGLCTAVIRALNPRRWGAFLDAARRML